MRHLLSFALALLCAQAAFAQTVARGTVFDDRDRNGKRDSGEPGIPEVCVSNGREVVRTNADGAWTLPVDDDCGIFVIKPRNWMTPVNGDQIPQHFYLHKPNGSPTKDVPGVAPTGPLPESIDFPLYSRPENDEFKVMLFGDTQARGLREVDFVTHDVVEECIGTDADFGISLGDNVADDPALFSELNQSIAQIGIPWYNTFGNHDNNRDAKLNEHFDETFERFFGPSTYAWEYGDVAFISINDVYFKETGGYTCRLTDDQLAFIKGYLDLLPKHRLVVFLMHIPYLRCENKDALFAIFADRPHTFSTAAHTHTQFHRFLTKEDGWPGEKPHHHFISATVCGSWWCGGFDELGIPHATMNDGAPNGYSMLSFDGTRYSIEFKAARRPADCQMNIYAPSELAAGEVQNTEVLVNVFAGSERSTVELRAGTTGAWIPLEQTRTIDPQCLRMSELGPYLDSEVNGVKLDTVFGWKMDYPSETDHIWKGKLPKLEAGTHTLFVRTTDMFGQVYVDHRIVRVRP